MHAKLVVPMYLMLLQTLGFQKLSESVDLQKKIPSFNLAWLSLGNFLQRNSKPLDFCLAIAFTKFFISPSLICSGGIKTLSGSTKGLCWMFFTPGAYEFLVGHCFVS